MLGTKYVIFLLHVRYLYAEIPRMLSGTAFLQFKHYKPCFSQQSLLLCTISTMSTLMVSFPLQLNVLILTCLLQRSVSVHGVHIQRYYVIQRSFVATITRSGNCHTYPWKYQRNALGNLIQWPEKSASCH